MSQASLNLWVVTLHLACCWDTTGLMPSVKVWELLVYTTPHIEITRLPHKNQAPCRPCVAKSYPFFLSYRIVPFPSATASSPSTPRLSIRSLAWNATWMPWTWRAKTT